jgi:Uma2 family endonuclease
MVLRGGRIRFKASYIWDAPDDGKRYEVINGNLYVSPAPGWRHQFGLGNLFARLWNHITEHRLGVIVTAPVGVALDEENGVQPDIVYLSQARTGLISERGIEGAPDLVVEVLSPSTATVDRGKKMRRYAAAGILHYWLLNPANSSLEVYRLSEGRYQLVGIYRPGSVFQPELFPGLEIRIDDIWG